MKTLVGSTSGGDELVRGDDSGWVLAVRPDTRLPRSDVLPLLTKPYSGEGKAADLSQ